MPYSDLRKGRWSEPGRDYLVTTVTLHRGPLLRELTCARLLIRELAQVERAGCCTWLAWVLMPDHFHGLVRLAGTRRCRVVMRYLKARSAIAIGRHRRKPGPVWQSNYHDRALRQEDQRIAVARYVVANPLRADFVERIEEYPHWDCVWL